MIIKESFCYKGYMSKEAEEFFGENLLKEQREGVAVMGYFVKLSNGQTHMPSKGDVFKKYYNDSISVESIHRKY